MSKPKTPTATIPKGGPSRRSRAVEARVMRMVAGPGDPFGGRHRGARIQRFAHRNLTPEARAFKRHRRHIAQASQRGNYR